jgi:sulfite exporter TauE/SafE
MHDFLHQLLENSTFPIITALLLGIFTSIHPCPLTLNITAIGYIVGDLKSKKNVLFKGLIYTAGRVFSYMLITLVIYWGADALKISDFFEHYGELFIGPFLVLMGIVMLDVLPFSLSVTSKLNDLLARRVRNRHYGAFLLGCLFALIFCPHTLVLYFGMLIPLTMTSSEGFLLPVVFAIGTGLPVILVSWILTYSMSSINRFFSNLKLIEKWVRIITAIIFIFAGLYFIIETTFGIGHTH